MLSRVTEPPVLVVDEDSATRQLLREFLSEAGFASDEASDLQTALARAQGLKPAAVVVHDGVSGARGVEILESLRAHHPDLPVVFIAQGGDPRARRVASPATAYVDKPFRFADLLATLVRAVNAPSPPDLGRRCHAARVRVVPPLAQRRGRRESVPRRRTA